MSSKDEKPMKKKKVDEDQVEVTKPSLIAKKHHVIFHPNNDGIYHRVIAPGDDLSDVPTLYHENLKTEGVL